MASFCLHWCPRWIHFPPVSLNFDRPDKPPCGKYSELPLKVTEVCSKLRDEPDVCGCRASRSREFCALVGTRNLTSYFRYIWTGRTIESCADTISSGRIVRGFLFLLKSGLLQNSPFLTELPSAERTHTFMAIARRRAVSLLARLARSSTAVFPVFETPQRTSYAGVPAVIPTSAMELPQVRSKDMHAQISASLMTQVSGLHVRLILFNVLTLLATHRLNALSWFGIMSQAQSVAPFAARPFAASAASPDT